MKEATGELSMTAVVVVIIGILAVALPIIINQVIKTMERNANCSAAFGCKSNVCDADTTIMTCYYVPEKGENAGKTVEITCPCSKDTSVQ